MPAEQAAGAAHRFRHASFAESTLFCVGSRFTAAERASTASYPLRLERDNRQMLHHRGDRQWRERIAGGRQYRSNATLLSGAYLKSRRDDTSLQLTREEPVET